MPPEPPPPPPPMEKDKLKNLDAGVRDMFSAISRRLSALHANPRSSSSGLSEGEQVGVGDDNDDERGIRVITLAGDNAGATFKRSGSDPVGGGGGGGVPDDEDSDSLSTYVNSNFQAANNSIMMGGSYSANDPGVHMDIIDFVEQPRKKDKDKDKDKKRKTKKGESKSSGKDSD